MQKNYFLLFTIFSLFIISCNTEDTLPAPEASISFSKPYYLINETIEVVLETTNVRQVEWDFGNGYTSNEKRSLVIFYNEPGIYNISLILTSFGGEKKTISQKVAIGQYHAYEAVLHRAEGWREGDYPTDVKVEVRRYHSDPEPFWESAVVGKVGYEDLPITFPLNDIPLGGEGKGFYSYPLFRFIDVQTGDILAMAGAATSFQNLENEIGISSIGRHSLKYKLVLPEE